MDKSLLKIVNFFTRDHEHWCKVKEALEEKIRANEEDNKATREFIALIDSYVQEKEKEISKLN